MDYLKDLVMLFTYIPKEMYWGYEAVRQSGIYNMMCFHPIAGRYNDTNPNEVLNVIDNAYIRFCNYTNADISDKIYVHVTLAHIQLIQKYYKTLLTYYESMPNNVVKITKTTYLNYE